MCKPKKYWYMFSNNGLCCKNKVFHVFIWFKQKQKQIHVLHDVECGRTLDANNGVFVRIWMHQVSCFGTQYHVLKYWNHIASNVLLNINLLESANAISQMENLTSVPLVSLKDCGKVIFCTANAFSTQMCWQTIEICYEL